MSTEVNRSQSSEVNAATSVSFRANPLRAGIVGAGLMGRWHAAAIKGAGARTCGITDVDLSLAGRLASKHPTAEVFSNVEEMLNKVKLDVLHICTPLSTHNSIAEAAISRGVNIMIEKPVTPSAKETERLFDQAADRGVLICPVHQYASQDGVIKARKLIPRIGRIMHMEGVFCSAGAAGLGDEQQDTVAYDILPHPLYLMQMFLPSGLSESNWLTMRSAPGELRAMGEREGTSLAIFISMNARPTVCSFQITGTKGTIYLDMFHGYSFAVPGEVSRLRKGTLPFSLATRRFTAAALNLAQRSSRWEPAYPGLQKLISSFYSSIRSGGPPPILQADTIMVARVRDSIIKSINLTRG